MKQLVVSAVVRLVWLLAFSWISCSVFAASPLVFRCPLPLSNEATLRSEISLAADAKNVFVGYVEYTKHGPDATWAGENGVAVVDARQGTLLSTLEPPPGCNRGELFGGSVAVNDHLLAVGAGFSMAPRGSDGGRGRIFLYERPSLTLSGTIIAPKLFDELGRAICINGEGLASVAHGSQGAPSPSMICLYHLPDITSPTLICQPKTGRYVGAQMATPGPLLWVGDQLAARDYSNHEVLLLSQSGPNPVYTFGAPGRGYSDFGDSMSVHGDRMLFGDPHAYARSGTAYLYEISTRRLIHCFADPASQTNAFRVFCEQRLSALHKLYADSSEGHLFAKAVAVGPKHVFIRSLSAIYVYSGTDFSLIDRIDNPDAGKGGRFEGPLALADGGLYVVERTPASDSEKPLSLFKFDCAKLGRAQQARTVSFAVLACALLAGVAGLLLLGRSTFKCYLVKLAWVCIAFGVAGAAGVAAARLDGPVSLWLPVVGLLVIIMGLLISFARARRGVGRLSVDTLMRRFVGDIFLGLAAYAIFWSVWGLLSGATNEIILANRTTRYYGNLSVWAFLVFSLPWLGCWVSVHLESRPAWRILYWATPAYVVAALWGLAHLVSYDPLQQAAIYLAVAVPAFLGGLLLYFLARSARRQASE